MPAADTDAEMNSPDHQYVPSSPWTRLNDVPRIVIPPRACDFSQEPTHMTFDHPVAVDYESNQFGSPMFLRSLTKDGHIAIAHRMSEWKYVDRRACQSILPFVYLGPLSVTKNMELLRATGFTMLISIRSGLQRFMDANKVAEKLDIQSLNVDINSPSGLNSEFPKAIKALNDHLELWKDASTPASNPKYSGSAKVLVYCETGNDRSAAFVAAYLMAVFGFDLISAIQFVQSQRFSTGIGDPLKHALDTFGALLSATRDVGRANRLAAASPNDLRRSGISGHDGSNVPDRSKRTHDSIDSGEDNVLTQEGTIGMEIERKTMEAPFRDQQG